MNRRTVEVFNQVFTTGSVSKVTREVEAIASNLVTERRIENNGKIL